MKRRATLYLCRLLMAATMLLPYSAHAGMIGTEQAAAGARVARASLASVLERAEVASQLGALGVDAEAAKARVAAMTDEEARLLAGRIDTLPAGGTALGLALIVAALIAAAIIYRYR